MKKAQLLKGDLTEEFLEDFSKRKELGIDCEMMGLNPVRDRLCVVQIRAEEGPCALMQIDESIEYPVLKQVMENQHLIKIFHFARMDCLFLKSRLDIAVKNIYCTKIASRLARTYTDRHGLKDLVREVTGNNMDKTNQTSDWGKANLSADQLLYAENDVNYLFEIKRTLNDMLIREKRDHLADECFQFLPSRVELDQLQFGHIFDH